jgi:glycosyltransferase involved in cell wall biosynthesis
MNILIISNLYYPYITGGAEISTQIIAESLSFSGHSVSVLTSSKKKEEKRIINGVNVIYIPQRNIYWKYPDRKKNILKKLLWHTLDIYNVLYYRKIKTIITTISPDIIHTNCLCGISVIVWSIANKLNLKIVHTLRDYYLLCPQQAMMKGLHPCEKQCYICKLYSYPKKLLSNKVSAVIGISNFILTEHYKRKYFKNTIIHKVIPNSLPNEFYNRKKIDNKTIGYLGRIHESKGIELLIQSFIAVKKENNKLLIGGSGDTAYFNELKNKYESKQIIFLGQVETYTFLKSLDLLVVPSLWNEPFGRVVIEAFSMSCPVFASSNGGLTELIENGVGYYFSPQKNDELCDLLRRFFNDELSFDLRKFKSIVMQYDKINVINQYISLYEQLLS